MSTIPKFMTSKHRECDEIFSVAESAVAKEDWQKATIEWPKFCDELTLHFNAEETVLFPAFEQATGMTSGPTQVMRIEHEQMRDLVKSLNNALQQKDKTSFLGLSETLMVLMQQHNMKEEMMLYPMSEQQIANSGELVQSLEAISKATH